MADENICRKKKSEDFKGGEGVYIMKTIAIGCDHGGFELKEDCLLYTSEMMDIGTEDDRTGRGRTNVFIRSPWNEKNFRAVRCENKEMENLF